MPCRVNVTGIPGTLYLRVSLFRATRLLLFPAGVATTILQEAVAWEDEVRRTTDPGAPVPSPVELLRLAERGEGVVSPPQVNFVNSFFGALERRGTGGGLRPFPPPSIPSGSLGKAF